MATHSKVHFKLEKYSKNVDDWVMLMVATDYQTVKDEYDLKKRRTEWRLRIVFVQQSTTEEVIDKNT